METYLLIIDKVVLTFLVFVIILANLKLNIIVINIVGMHSNKSAASVMAILMYSICV